MLILPAIDLLEGACVRLRRGNYGRITRFSDDPISVARRFADGGAPWLHVVDLDGARDGRPGNRDAVRAIVRAVDVPVQTGGGIRDAAAAAVWLEEGVRRVILGTAAVERPETLGEVVERFGTARVAAAVELQEDRLRVEGWRRTAGIGLEEALDRLAAVGLTTLLYTDIRRDGTLLAPNVEGARRLIAAGWRVLVAGGVARPSHVVALREAGAAGVVIGSALYRGTMTLAEALEAARGGGEPAPC